MALIEGKKEVTWGDLWSASKIVFSYVAEDKKSALFLAVSALFSAFFGASVPFLVGKFIDALTLFAQGPSLGFGWVPSLSLWFIVVFVGVLVDWRLGLASRRIGTRVHVLANARWFNNILLLPLNFHKQKKKGEVNSKITRGSSYLSRLIEDMLLNVGPQMLAMLMGIGFACFLQPYIAAVIFVGMVLYGFVSVYTAIPLVQMQSEGNKAWNEAYGDSHDAMNNIQSIKHAGAENLVFEKNNHNFLEKTFLLWMRPEVTWAKIRFTQRVFVVLTQLSVFLLSVHLVTSGQMTIGELVALNGYTAMVFGPLAQLAVNWNTIQTGLTTIRDVQDIMEMEPEAYERQEGVVPEKWGGSVLFEHVSFAYPDAPEKVVLKDVSFEIKDGQTVALVGESGVGKSTSVELIGGYYYPTEGEILVSGMPTTQLPLRALREQIAVVPQEPVLFNDTVMNNIRFGRSGATDEEVYEAAKKAHADEFIMNFPDQYAQIVGERGVKLSVGQKQRIAIARAVLRNPKILILDEPTSALDAKTESKITASLESLMKGRTTIIIAHRLSTVRTADNIIVFEGGVVVEQGTHATLLARGGVYAELYAHQVGVVA